MQKGENPDLILLNGHIWTAKDESTFEEALAIKATKIVLVGSSKIVAKLAGPHTQMIDLKGRLVIPGFNDAHIHFLSGSAGLSQADLTDATSPADVVERIAKFAILNPTLKWITGRGWQYTTFPGGMPSSKLLKGMVSSRPIFITAYDGHSGWANQMALDLAGIDMKSKYEGFGQIVLDSHGEPTGVLLEEAQSLVSKLIPEMSHEEKLNALRDGMKMAALLGITSVQNASGSPEEFSLYEELLKNGELTIRYAAAFSANANTTTADIEAYTRIKKRTDNRDSRLTASAIKFMLDGVIESHTAAMLSPYSDVTDNSRGDFALPLEKYRSLVVFFDQIGFRIYTHAIGDRAVREALNAYEQAQNQNGSKSRRHRVEHIETISPKDLHRFAQLGVLASMEPIHADPGTMAVWSNAIGTERLPYSFAWASLLNENAYLIFSSDWPACVDVNPIRGIHVAINRRTLEGFPTKGWVVDQKISAGKALLAYTKAGAYSSFEESVKGQIASGFLADIVVLSQDLFKADPMRVYESRVVMTIFDGKVIYRDSKSF